MNFEVANYEVAGEEVNSYTMLTALSPVDVNAPERRASTIYETVQFGTRAKASQGKIAIILVKQQRSSRRHTLEQVVKDIVVDKLTEHVDKDSNDTLSESRSDGYSCQHCNKYYARSSSLTKHISSKHATLQQEAAITGGNASMLSAMANNQLASVQDDLLYQCTLCEDKFPSLSALETHMEVIMCIRPYKCSLCSQAFLVPIELDNHVKSHSSSVPSKCDLFASSFNRSCDLKAHENSHRPHVVSSKLENHVNLLSSVKPFKCDLCTSTFSRSGDLRSHRKQGHRSDKPHRCSVCRKNFRTVSDLEFHMLCHGEKPYQCPHCEWTNDNFKNIRNHVAIRHKNERRFQCPSCEWKFFARTDLKRHLRNQHGKLICGHCDMVFENDRLLGIHLWEHKKERSTPCPYCNKTYANDQNMRRHMQIHDQRYVCTQCCWSGTSADELHEHLTKHVEKVEKLSFPKYRFQGNNNNGIIFSTSGKQFPCYVCGKVFTRKRSDLDAHMSVHDPKTYACCQCCFKFRYAASLQKHMARHPVGGMSKCTLCDEEFASVSDLESHVKSSHTGSFKCDKCDEFLWTWKDLTLHRKSHGAERKFQCLTCHKFFLCNTYLNRHIAHYHNNAAKFKCPSCMRLFFNTKQLDRHVKKHESVNSEPQYCCDRCSKMFFTKLSLKQHLRRIHNDYQPLGGNITVIPVNGEHSDALNTLVSDLIAEDNKGVLPLDGSVRNELHHS